MRRRLRSAPPAILLGLALIAATPASTGEASDDAIPSPDWIFDLDRGLAAAAERGVPVLVDVFADWCQPCHVMERETYGNPEVISALRGFVAVQLDAERDGKRADRYGVTILPTTLVLEPNGRLVASVSGQLGPDAMLRLIEQVSNGWSDYRGAVASPGDPDAMDRAAGYLVRLGNFDGAARMLQLAAGRLRADGASDERIHSTELKIAQAKFAAGAWREAEAEFRRLADTGASPTIRAMALVGLADGAERQGRASVAERFRRQVREEYPEIARRLDL